MKLQIKYKVREAEGTLKKVSKTFSTIDQGLEDSSYVAFAKAYVSLVDSPREVEVYKISVEMLEEEVR